MAEAQQPSPVTPSQNTDQPDNIDEEKAENAGNAVQDSNGSGSPSPAKRSTVQNVLLMTAACMSIFLAALDMTIVTTALPTIAEHFGSSAGFAWVGSAFMLAAASTTANWGKFSDVWGRKPVLLVASVVFFVGCTLCGAAQRLPVLIAGRAVQGAGAGGLLTLVNIIIGDLFSARDRGKYYGIIGMVWATAGALGPVVGGALTSRVSWRWCFYINLPISGTAFFIIFFTLHLPTPHTPLLAGLRAIDWLGSLALSGGTLMLLLGLQFGGDTHPWRSAMVIGLIVGGVLTLLLFFAVIERRLAVFPILPTHLYASSLSNIAVLAVCLFHGLAFVQLTYYLPIYFQAVLGTTPLLSGVWLLATSMATSVCAALSGIYLQRTGRPRDPILFGLTLATLGCALLCDLPHSRNQPSSTSAWARTIIFQILAGAGLGFNFQPPLVALQSNVPSQDNASVTASFALTRNIASAIGVVTGSAAFTNQMAGQHAAIAAAIGNAQIADLLTGGSAQANLFLVNTLSPAAQAVVRSSFYTALRPIWIQMAVFSFMGLASACLIRVRPLRRVHETIETGLAGEERRRQIALEQRAKAKQTQPEEVVN